MANGEKVQKEKLPEPTFIEQANTFIDKKFEDAKLIEDPKFGPGLSIFDHKVLAGVMELQVNHVNDILVEKYTYQISETYTQLTRVLNEIKTDQKVNFKKINDRLEKAEKMAKKALDKATKEEAEIITLNLRVDKKRDDIATLRIDFEVNKKSLEEIAKLKPTLMTLQNAFNFWQWKNWYKIAGIIFAILFVFALLVVGLNFFMHKTGWVTDNMINKHTYNVNDIYSRMRTGDVSTTTRGVESTIHYTDAQRDSLLTIDQHNIKIGIDKRNEEYKKLEETWRNKK